MEIERLGAGLLSALVLCACAEGRGDELEVPYVVRLRIVRPVDESG